MYGHEQSRHQREMKCHMTFVTLAAAKIRDGFLGPLVGLREQHSIPKLLINVAS